MKFSWYYLKQNLKKIKPLYEWYSTKKSNKRCELLQVNGYDVSSKITNILEKSNISYFYTYGTLLGLVRDSAFMKHDDDIDIGIVNTKDFSWSNLNSLLTKGGFVKSHEFILNGNITEQTYVYNGTSIDFFIYEYDQGKMMSYVYFNKKGHDYENQYQKSVAKMISSEIIDFKNIVINGVNFRIPKNDEQYLKDIYGASWTIPNPNWISENGPAWNEIKKTYGTYVPKK
ncbi:LicD family protein [Clostridium oceanicum]|uniref:LicD family protein n=1 Tax=Clostridium oceanicum TaxID=1543 RepID=A0ABP3V2N0_9CLOT